MPRNRYIIDLQSALMGMSCNASATHEWKGMHCNQRIIMSCKKGQMKENHELPLDLYVASN